MIRRLCAAVFASVVIALMLFEPLAQRDGDLRVARAASIPAHVDPALYRDLRWRNIGPYRGGRSVAATGVAGDSRTFYFGAVGGGVWKSENAGLTWRPIMDAMNVASIGAVAVAPSDPKTLYVGSGEADMRSDIAHGNGMYRSTDAGATWSHIGLDDSRQIGRILISPTDPKTLVVAVLGHGYGPNAMRGVYRSTDGGTTWVRTLARDADTGAIDLASDPAMHDIFVSLWNTRRPPWSVYPPSYGPGSGLYHSLDGGATWALVTGAGLPTERVGKIGIAVAPSDPNRVYAIVDAKAGGLYRSDDGGASWRLVDKDKRLWDRGWYFGHVTVDPRDAGSVYVSDTSVYHSSDGGVHFAAIKGSPDGDDFHQLWIDPTEPTRMVLASDQGTSVSLDGARSWSSWFNQPTGQFYHVTADATVPYHLFGAQQDNGAAMILSRSDHRGIEERDWRAIVAGGESGTVAVDPRQPDMAYGTVGGGSDDVVVENLRTNQTRAIKPTLGLPGPWRAEWTQPIVFGRDGALYATNQRIFRSRDRGMTWRAISRDLARSHAGTPSTLDVTTAADIDGPEPRGVVYALAPSPRDATMLWAGTDDGTIHRTTDDGRTWHDVTPPTFAAWSHVDGIEASHFDSDAAYVALDRHRLDDDRPYVYATHDGGRTWREAHDGIPQNAYVNVVREDPLERGLLYAGTEQGVFVSFDDGISWQSLRANMPVVSVRDLIVHDGDLAIATHGRALWVLDDVQPLRDLARARSRIETEANDGPRLYTLRDAVRMRGGNDEAEATPPEIPLGENPPSGAFVDYVVPPNFDRSLQLEIRDRRGALVRSWSSSDPNVAPNSDALPYPPYWLPAPQALLATPGMHRFVWDFHVGRADGPLAAPGTYEVRLVGSRTAPGQFITRRLVLRRDPRVPASDADLVAQYDLARAVDSAKVRVDARVSATSRGTESDSRPSTVTEKALRDRSRALGELEASIESADAAPTAAERAAWARLRVRL